MSACPDEDALLAYIEAGLSGEGGLDAHVDGCERCRQVVAALGPLPLSDGAKPPPAPPSADPGEAAKEGELIAGKYRVLGELGRGGMGVVFEAEHVAVAERFAIKVVRAEGGEAGAKRFVREAKLAAQVGGRHVARVFDVGSLGDGRMYLVMERLFGEDLQSALRRRGALPVGEALGYALQACEAVGRAHAAGVIHRDLKPANLFLVDEEGGVLVKALDFGLAKLSARPRVDDGLSLTTSATIIGSPRYMSPEQIRDARAVDERSDIWSLGVILFEMLAGEPPFSGTTISGLWASIVADPPRPLRGLRPEVPEAIATVVEACLAKDPKARPSSAAELSARLSAARDGAVGGAKAAAPEATPSGRRRPVATLLAAAALCLVPLGAVLVRGRGARGEAPSSPAARAPSLASALIAGGAPSGALPAPSGDGRSGAPPASSGGAAAAAGPDEPAPSAPSAPKRPPPGRGKKDSGQRVRGAASVNDIFFGKETDSRH